MMNLLALRSSARISHSPAIFPRNNLHPRHRSDTGISTICFSTASHDEQSPEMDTDRAKELPKEAANENVMYSFGEGYSTRSDEEGFGGIYGGNDDEALGMKMKKKKNESNHVHENHPEYDKEQGSEVKEKEKARHQANLDP